MNWYVGALKKYADFQGRARRKEYWMFGLVNCAIYVALLYVDHRLGTLDDDNFMGVVSTIYLLAVLFPSVAVTVRRLHDVGISGWWFLVAFIPFVGDIALLVLTVLDGSIGTNEYGSNPKSAPLPAGNQSH